MIQKIDFHIKEFDLLKKYPKELFYLGNTTLLKKKKISIVGTRRPSQYTKMITFKLAQELAKRDIAIVSGCAMGVDTLSHNGAGSSNTIGVVANGLDIRYPTVNKNLIMDIEKNGLMLSQFAPKEKARNYSFVLRNELVVALGDILIVTEADLNSGSLTSVDYALKMGKKVYTISHRIDENKGCLKYIEKGLIEPIYSLDNFLNNYKPLKKENYNDEFFDFCKKNPNYDDIVKIYGEKVFEYELEGFITVNNGIVSLK